MVDGVLALCRWLEVAPETFVDGGTVPGEPLPPPGTGFARVDMDLVARAVGRDNLAGRTRTTIQRLVTAADEAGLTVTSLTRLSNG